MSNSNWFKGNLHTHTTESDGDETPEHVAEWYREHGYDFLVLSDHNHLTVLDDAGSNPGKWPLLIPGEEITSRLFDNTVPVHVNGIGLHTLVEPAYEESMLETLQENVSRIVAAARRRVKAAKDCRRVGRSDKGVGRPAGLMTVTF